jgi:hypothetical protein
MVAEVRTMLQANLERSRSTSVVSEIILGGVIAGLVGLWLMLCAIRFKMRRAHRTDDETAEPADRKAALLGSMFGTPAGCWIYDKLFRGPPGTVPLPEPEPAAPAALEGEAAVADGPPADESPEGAHVPPAV